VVRDEEVIIPKGNDQLLAGDLVYFISEEEHLLATLSIFDKHAQPIKRVLIVGGGRIGYRLATKLEPQSIYCKIIEKNAQRCAFLADKLNKAVVLHGDGSDQGLLSEENVADIDVVVTLTNDEETNILASLLATRLGAGKAITKISKFSYFPLITAIGIEQVVSPRLSAINTILQHIRRGKVLSAISLKGEQAEALEVVALESSRIVSKPLAQVAFPKGPWWPASSARKRSSSQPVRVLSNPGTGSSFSQSGLPSRHRKTSGRETGVFLMRWRYMLYRCRDIGPFFGMTMLVPLACLFAYQDQLLSWRCSAVPGHYYRRRLLLFLACSKSARFETIPSGKAWPLSRWVGRPWESSARCPST
jgi:Trk K+ transport system NAD-binding subunit